MTHLVFRPAAEALAALPTANVREMMRPLPVEAIAGAPAFVLGAAIVRGRAVPVVDAARLVAGASVAATRWISLEVAGRSVVLAVHSVLGVRRLTLVSDSAPLLAGAAKGVIDQLGSLDRELLAVLRAARVLELADAG